MERAWEVKGSRNMASGYVGAVEASQRLVYETLHAILNYTISRLEVCGNDFLVSIPFPLNQSINQIKCGFI